MTTLLTVMCAAIGAVGICLGFITKKLCQMIDEQEIERRLLESRTDSTFLLYQEHQKALENRIKKLETDLNHERDIRREAIDQAKEEAAAAVKKEAALRQNEIESHKAETYLALYGKVGFDGKSFCGVPVVDPKNKPWTAFKWTFGDDHGTK